MLIVRGLFGSLLQILLFGLLLGGCGEEIPTAPVVDPRQTDVLIAPYPGADARGPLEHQA